MLYTYAVASQPRIEQVQEGSDERRRQLARMVRALLRLLPLRSVSARARGGRYNSTSSGSKKSEDKSVFEHIMEYRMPVSLGVTCLVCVELRRAINGSRKDAVAEAPQASPEK